MQGIRLVEYDPSYAAGVADMWSKSGDSWGGYNVDLPAETVRRDEAASPHLNLYLALDGDVVAGYCKLSEYREDEGALYIDGLNVRPDYHGRKIGKALVLRCVGRTAELGWPRLDLYTWEGNLRAVPLYKKCGFFWEDRDDATHFMNFIPTVLATELTKPIFGALDWYEASRRPIEVKPDGRRESGFDFYTYSWEKGDRRLEMEFCRRGRGLRRIDTNEYGITATVSAVQLVFGRTYQVVYDIVCKTGKPLQVSIRGRDDKNIRFALDESLVVRDRARVAGEFAVDPVAEPQSVWKMHPRVSARITVDGGAADFHVGIAPNPPAELTLRNPARLCYRGAEAVFFADLESNFGEEAAVRFELPEDANVQLLERSFQVVLGPRQRRSVPVPFRLRRCGVYAPTVTVRAEVRGGEPIVYRKKVGAGFHTESGFLWGETDRLCLIGSGRFALALNRREFANIALLYDVRHGQLGIIFMPPKLGKPYSSEFHRRPYESADFRVEDAAVTLRLRYRSEERPEVGLESCYRLDTAGILEHWFEIRGADVAPKGAAAAKGGGGRSPGRDLWITQSLRVPPSRFILPYEGRFVEAAEDEESYLDLWEASKLTENWLFARRGDMRCGIAWPEGAPVQMAWSLFFEYHAAGGQPVFRSEPVTASVNAIRDWHRFRELALRREAPREPLTKAVELEINGGNPFVGGSFRASVAEHRRRNLDGRLALKAVEGSFHTVRGRFQPQWGTKRFDADIRLHRGRPLDVLTLDARLGVPDFQRQKAFFTVPPGEVETREEKWSGHTVYAAENGLLSLRAAPAFGPVLFSCSYREREWLHTSFPTPVPRAVWNPWIGGLGCRINDLRMKSLLRERRSARFVSREDGWGNAWKGIRLDVAIMDNERFEGLAWRQYFLLLPGVPVVLHAAEIVLNTGRLLDRTTFCTELWGRPSGRTTGKGRLFGCSFHYVSEEGRWCRLRAGLQLGSVPAGPLFLLEGAGRGEKLLVLRDADVTPAHLGVRRETMHAVLGDIMSFRSDERVFLPPKFLIFLDRGIRVDRLDRGVFEDLLRLRLKGTQTAF